MRSRVWSSTSFRYPGIAHVRHQSLVRPALQASTAAAAAVIEAAVGER